MGKKIFVSYKFKDSRVEDLSKFECSTARDYVTKLENKLGYTNHIYKGESDDEDLSELSDETIWEKLKDRIYDSSVTVIFVSPGMKEDFKNERVQWIPWEVSYSLKETSRRNAKGESVTSRSNAMIAVVLPDEYGKYDYYLETRDCCSEHCVTHHWGKLFSIIRNNKFNLKDPKKYECSNNEKIWCGDVSYIEAVRWCDFIDNYNHYINRACKRQDNIDDYKIEKEL